MPICDLDNLSSAVLLRSERRLDLENRWQCHEGQKKQKVKSLSPGSWYNFRYA
jgi:hypothetical protein